MRGDVHAYHADRPGIHRADRRCACGPTVYRDAATGRLSVWVHRPPPPPPPKPFKNTPTKEDA